MGNEKAQLKTARHQMWSGPCVLTARQYCKQQAYTQGQGRHPQGDPETHELEVTLGGQGGQGALVKDNKIWVMTHIMTPLDTEASDAQGDAGYKSLSEAIIISPFVFHRWQGQKHSNWRRIVQRLRQIVACCIPYFIGSAHNQMNSGTHHGSLLLTVCARKHVSPSYSSPFIPRS